MARARRYPKASTSQWFQDDYPGVDMGGVEKVLLHTTETGTWPGYRGGASAPTLTYDPRKRQWRQHFDLNRSARALRDPSGTAVRENRDRVVQVEIICSCDRSFARKHGYLYVADLSAAARQDIADFISFMHDEWGVPLVAAPLWLPYPASYGDSRARMSGPTYDRFRGVLGHMHASGNTHGDPGEIPIDDIMRRTTEEDDMPYSDWPKADRDALVKDVSAVVYGAVNDGIGSPGDTIRDVAYAAVQAGIGSAGHTVRDVVHRGVVGYRNDAFPAEMGDVYQLMRDSARDAAVARALAEATAVRGKLTEAEVASIGAEVDALYKAVDQ